uniref:Oxysterol-binding protein n=1 Tax=Scleropages formosus TaxID=113540 RepID=A0A8C9W3A3_SCLFO
KQNAMSPDTTQMILPKSEHSHNPPHTRQDTVVCAITRHCYVRASLQDSWEIVEGLRGGISNVQEPQKQEGFLLKRRKWPMKGWHKRYFLLDKGILKYAKSGADIEKGKLHGCIDVGLSVMAIKKKAKCIDLDAEENIYHLKMKTQELFDEWVSKLRHHRLFRQNEIAMYPHEKPLLYSHFPPVSPILQESASMRKCSTLTRQSSVHPPGSFPVTFTSQAKVAAWLQSSDDMDKCTKELSVCESYLLDLQHLLKSMEVLHRTYSAPAISALQVHMPLNLVDRKETGPQILLQAFILGVEGERILKRGVRLKRFVLIVCLKQPPLPFQAVAQNSELKDRLSRIHAESCIVEPAVLTNVNTGPLQESTDGSRPLVHQTSNESRASVTESLSEFFDAQEVLLSASSSENEASDDDSYISDISDNMSMDNFSNEVESERSNPGAAHSRAGVTGPRRSCLPSPSPNTSSLSLWNILRNNIGKDLSKVAMPVALNEPLNTLQRLCEELEYSELLDQAAATLDPFERMVTTFAVSGYASSYCRAGGKPFNPVLGETYECDRPDKGFRFIAEQVSHHPPISACHAESKNFIFWQDMRWKNKFWGKSMEIVPVGITHVVLPGFGDHYEWNKVTSCIHNILSGQRWIEHYGEISIKNRSSDICQCKVTFIKAKYWNSAVNEVEGSVTDDKGKVIHTLFGKWHEGMYCGNPPSATCVWRANAMPPDHEQYYGFTKLAIELNEVDPAMKALLPPTDTRLRPDQRLLEEGNVEAAEVQKQRIEQLQRDRRRVLEENNMMHQPRFFKKLKDDTWVSNNTYWDLRKDSGFSNVDFPVLW